ncbi:unnamed protein product [Amoebophrya sp. A120]|nr:unnamed protein product [Amoebophrya sp. A120]|eukprot:GSA120T00004520001.1
MAFLSIARSYCRAKLRKRLRFVSFLKTSRKWRTRYARRPDSSGLTFSGAFEGAPGSGVYSLQGVFRIIPEGGPGVSFLGARELACSALRGGCGHLRGGQSRVGRGEEDYLPRLCSWCVRAISHSVWAAWVFPLFGQVVSVFCMASAPSCFAPGPDLSASLFCLEKNALDCARHARSKKYGQESGALPPAHTE